MLFELLFRKHPFYQKGTDLLKSILAADLKDVFGDEEYLSTECIECLTAMLQKKSADRKWETVKSTKWLQ